MSNELIVTEKAQRQASMDGTCFYCRQPIGTAHKPDCVLVAKRVKVRMVVEYEIVVPHHWDKGDIEFHRNDGSWCADNAIDELQKLAEREGCLCQSTSFTCENSNGAAFLDEDGSA